MLLVFVKQLFFRRKTFLLTHGFVNQEVEQYNKFFLLVNAFFKTLSPRALTPREGAFYRNSFLCQQLN